MVQNAGFVLKIDKTRCVKGNKKWLFTYFLACFFARTK